MTLDRLTEAEWAALQPGDEVALVIGDYLYPRPWRVRRPHRGGLLIADRPEVAGSRTETVKRLGRDRYLVRITDEVRAHWQREHLIVGIESWLYRVRGNLRRLPDEALALLDEARKRSEVQP